MNDLSEIKNKGYWQVDGEQFDNKINAILAAQKKNTEVTFHYNDRWWNEFDWAVEPTKTLDELYVERAQQLRAKYKTLILRFSGGSDSTNIIRTFLDNNIKIDIVVINDYEGLSGLSWADHQGNLERKLITYPTAKKLLDEGADFELMSVDSSYGVLVIKDDPDWIFKYNAPRLRAVEINAPRMGQSEKLAKYNNPDTCIISGLDKPAIRLLNDKLWVSCVSDSLPVLADPGHSNMIQEPFYWTADLPELPIKQNHVVKNWAKEHLDLLPEDKCLFGTKNIMVPLIYPKYYNFTPGDPLPYFDTLCFTKHIPYDNVTDWGMEKTPVYESHRRGVDLADSLIEDRFKVSSSIWNDGLKPIYTKPRWLGR
jgi:hypothetical protein